MYAVMATKFPSRVAKAGIQAKTKKQAFLAAVEMLKAHKVYQERHLTQLARNGHAFSKDKTVVVQIVPIKTPKE